MIKSDGTSKNNMTMHHTRTAAYAILRDVTCDAEHASTAFGSNPSIKSGVGSCEYMVPDLPNKSLSRTKEQISTYTKKKEALEKPIILVLLIIFSPSLVKERRKIGMCDINRSILDPIHECTKNRTKFKMIISK